MRKLFIAVAALAAAVFSASARETVKAGSPLLTYVGRTLNTGSSVSFDWSGVSAIVRFSGKYLELTYEDSGKNYVNVWVDREPGVQADFVLPLGGEGTVTLVEGLRKGEHTVYIQKRTEGEQGMLVFVSFGTDGAFLQARPLKERKMLFIGDSYTCGYGAENSVREDPFRPEDENPNLTYAAIAGRYFDAEVVRVSHSGRGIVRNYADYEPSSTMVTKYPNVFDGEDAGPVFDASSYVPGIVVIYLGTNDFSVGKQPSLSSWCGAYQKLLEAVRADYPSAPVLCLASKADEKMAYYVEEAVRRAGISNVHWTAIHTPVLNDTTDLGASWHPNYEGNRKIASCVIPCISTLTGWEMPLKAVE